MRRGSSGSPPISATAPRETSKTMPDVPKVVGSEALGSLIYDDFNKLVTAVESLPQRAESDGLEEAIRFARVHLRLLADAVCLEGADTPSHAKAIRRVHMALSEGHLRVYCRPDRAGSNSRAAFLEAVEREFVASSIHAVFRHYRDVKPDDDYKPIVMRE